MYCFQEGDLPTSLYIYRAWSKLAGRDMSTSKKLRAEEAAAAFEDESVIGCGEYSVIDNQSGSLQATLAREFTRQHDLSAGESLDVWMDVRTGALIILPQDHE